MQVCLFSLSVAELREFGFAYCPMIICADGINQQSRFFQQDKIIDYNEYLDSLQNKFQEAEFIVHAKHMGLTKSLESGLKKVKTEYCFPFQHDIGLGPKFIDIDLNKKIEKLRKTKIKFYSFRRDHEIFTAGEFCRGWWRETPFSFLPEEFDGSALDFWKNEISLGCHAGFGFQDHACIIKPSQYIDIIRNKYDANHSMFVEATIQEEMRTFTVGDYWQWMKYGVAVDNAGGMVFHLDGHSKSGDIFPEELWSQGICHPAIIKDYTEWMKDSRCSDEFKKCFYSFLGKETSSFDGRLMRNNGSGDGKPVYISK